jgi:hypothetical protein
MTWPRLMATVALNRASRWIERSCRRIFVIACGGGHCNPKSPYFLFLLLGYFVVLHCCCRIVECVNNKVIVIFPHLTHF